MTLRTCFCLALALSACGSSEGRDSFANTPSDDAGSSGPVLDNSLGDASTTPQIPVCAEHVKNKVFVVSETSDFYSFEPQTLKFTKIGKIDCRQFDADFPRYHTQSMAVDREGFAWINVNNGQTYKIDTKTGTCFASGKDLQSTNFGAAKLGFATEGTTAEEWLYGNHPLKGGRGLSRLKPATYEITTVGGLNGDLASDGELTGTGDGQLFGFFKTTAGQKWTLGSINPTNAKVTKVIDVDNTSTPGAGGNTAYAFSFWGGDFWFYYSENGQPTSKVLRYKAATDKTQEIAVANVADAIDDHVPFRITGAGVSTCAPTKPVVN